MRRVRLLFLIVLGTTVAASLAWLLASGRITTLIARTVERALSADLHTPIRVGRVAIAPLRLRVEVERFEIGPEGEALRVGAAVVRVMPGSTIRQRRLVGAIEASDVRVAPAAFPTPKEDDGPGEHRPFEFPFPFRAARVTVRRAEVSVPVDGRPLLIRAGTVDGTVEVNARTHRVALDARAASIELERGRARVALEQASLTGAQTSRGLEALSAEVRGDGIEARGERTSMAPVLVHALRGRASLNWLQLFVPEWSPVETTVGFEAMFHGSLADPKIIVSASTERVETSGLTLTEVRADGAREGRLLELRSATATAGGGQVSARGRLWIDPRLSFEATGSWQNVNAAALLPGNAIAANAADGNVTVSGTFEPLTVAVDAGGAVAAVAGGPALTWRGTGSSHNGALEGQIAVAQGEPNHGWAVVSSSADGSVQGQAEVHVADTTTLRRLLRPLDVPAVGGAFDIGAGLQGTLAAPEATAWVSGRNVDAYGALADRLDGSFIVSPTRVRSDGVTISTGGGTVTAAGIVSFDAKGENEWTLGVTDLPADTVSAVLREVAGVTVPVWRGGVSAEVTGHGTWRAPILQGQSALREFRIGTEPFESVSVEADVRWPEWRGSVRLLHRPGETLDVEARGRGLDDVDLTARSTEWALGQFRRASLAECAGTASLGVELHGPLGAASGTAAIDARDVTWAGRRFGNGHLDARGERGAWRVEGGLFDDRVRAEGELSTAGGWPFETTVRWVDAEVASLLSSDAAMRLTTTGDARIRGRLKDLTELDGEMRVERLVLERGAYSVRAVIPIVIGADRGRFAIRSLVVEGIDGSRLVAAGGWSTRGDVDLRVNGQGDLAAAELVSRHIKSSRGQFSVAASVARTAEGDLKLAGQGSISGGALDVGLPIVLTDLDAAISLADRIVHVDHLTARAGNGTVTVGGTVDVMEGPALTWSVTEMSARVVDWLEHEVSARGFVRGRWDDFTVGGEVDVLKVLYEKRIALTDFLPWFRARLAPPPERPAPGRVVRLDLHVSAPSDVFIDNNFAKMELRADVRVDGTIDDVQVTGPIEVVSGQVTFRDRVFDVTAGVVEFRRELGLNPVLNISAETVVRTADASYNVMVQVVGTGDDYRVLLSCDDAALSQNDIASLITFGKTTAQLQQSGAGFSSADVLALGGGAYKEQIEREVRGLLPIDRINIEPAFSRTTGAFEPRVTIGKDFTEDLTGQLTTSFGVESRRTVQLEYRLLPGVGLLGSWESETKSEAGAFGGGLKFHREFRRLPFLTLLGDGGGGSAGDATQR